jgi:hypothetical protein
VYLGLQVVGADARDVFVFERQNTVRAIDEVHFGLTKVGENGSELAAHDTTSQHHDAAKIRVIRMIRKNKIRTKWHTNTYLRGK